MGSIRTACVLMAIVPVSAVAAQERLWAVPMSPLTSIAAVRVDGSGGVFVVGSTGGSVGGPSAGGSDVWLARYSARGETEWIRQIGTVGDDYGMGIAPDGFGGIFVCGGASGDVGGGVGGAWVARYSGDGLGLWIEQFGGAESSATALCTNGQGGCFAAGTDGSTQRWLAQFDENGGQSWMRPFNDTYWPLSLAPDGAGGVFQGAGNLGSVAYVARHDHEGTPLWTDQFGNPLGMRAYGPWTMIPDASGGVIAIGFADYHPALGSSTWFARYTAGGVQAALLQNIPDLAFAAADLGGGEVLLAGSALGRFDLNGQQLWTDPAWERLGLAASARSAEEFFVASSAGWGGGDYALVRYGACYANCDDSSIPPALNAADFVCFLHGFAAGHPYANCDQSTTPPVLNVADFSCFLQRFAAGCP